MAQNILILGESGCGKSSSIRTLPHQETFIINVNQKALPFRGSKSMYKKFSDENKEGNYYCADEALRIIKCLKYINDNRPEIKYIIIDDFGYCFVNSYMRKAHEKGFTKFTELAFDAWSVFEAMKMLRQDLFCFVMMHTELDAHNCYKPRTVGKLTDSLNVIEGIFSNVLHALVVDGKFQFLTTNDSVHMAHTLMDLFPDKFIDNDLKLVVDTIKAYEEQDIEM